MSKATNVKVTLRQCKNNTERMIRRFLKKTKKEKIIEECREREFYQKPSDKKRADRRRAKRLREKELRKQQALAEKNR